jgi:hypothetical protein
LKTREVVSVPESEALCPTPERPEDAYLMELALAEARLALAEDEVPIGALVVGPPVPGEAPAVLD